MSWCANDDLKKSWELTGSEYFRALKLIETFGNKPLSLYKILRRQAQSPSSKGKDGGKTLPTKPQSSACSFVFALALHESYIISCELEIDIHTLGHYQNLNSKQVHNLIFTHYSLPLYCLAGSLLLWSLWTSSYNTNLNTPAISATL